MLPLCTFCSAFIGFVTLVGSVAICVAGGAERFLGASQKTWSVL
jgi:hypothetical protein